MNTGASRSLVAGVGAQGNIEIAATLERPPSPVESTEVAQNPNVGQRVRVYVAAENRLLREALARMLAKHGSIEIVGLHSATPLDHEALPEGAADVLLLPDIDLSILQLVTSLSAVCVLLCGFIWEVS